MAIILIRTFVLFFALLLAMRLLGKRQLGELELSELVVSVVIADLASNPLQDIGIPLLNGLLPILVLFCLELILSGVSLRSIKLRNLFYGKPSLLIQDGKIIQSAMRKNRFTLDELAEELQKSGTNRHQQNSVCRLGKQRKTEHNSLPCRTPSHGWTTGAFRGR